MDADCDVAVDTTGDATVVADGDVAVDAVNGGVKVTKESSTDADATVSIPV